MGAFRLVIIILAVAVVAPQSKADPYDRDIVLEGAIEHVAASSSMANHYSSLGAVLGNKNKHIRDEMDIYEVVGEVRKIMDKWDSTFVLAKLMTQKPPEEAIQLFGQLPAGIIQCNFDGYTILARNYAAAVGNERLLKPTDKIKSSVLAAIQEHGRLCRSEYFQRFKDALEQIEPEEMDQLKGLLNYELLDKIFPKDLKGALRTTKLLEKFKKIVSLPLLLKLAELVKGRPEAKYLKSIPSDASLREKKSEFETNIVEKYLLEPCRTLIYAFSDVLEPAKLDLSSNDDILREINPEQSYLLRDYWKRYLFCSMLETNYIVVSQELASRARGKF